MSQEKQILRHLQSGRSITPFEALEFYGCLRLASRIENLRKTYPDIETNIIGHKGKKYASYRLKPKEDLFG